MQTDKEEKRREGRIGKKKKIYSLKQFIESHKETHEQREQARAAPAENHQIKGCNTEAIQPRPERKKEMQLKASNAGKNRNIAICRVNCAVQQILWLIPIQVCSARKSCPGWRTQKHKQGRLLCRDVMEVL